MTELKSYYFTFGQDHRHVVARSENESIVLDKDVVVQIDAEEYWKARKLLITITGTKWAFQYTKKPDMSYYPRGIIQISFPEIEHIDTAKETEDETTEK